VRTCLVPLVTDDGLGDPGADDDPDGPGVEGTEPPPHAAAEISRSGAVSSTAVRKTARTRGGVRERARRRELFQVVTNITSRFSGAARLAPAIDDELVARECRMRGAEESDLDRLAAAPIGRGQLSGGRRRLPTPETRHVEP
jgi:hypothetical protein